MYPGGWALMAEEFLTGIDPLYDNLESFNKWIDEDWGFAYQDRIYAPGDAVLPRSRPRRRRTRPGPRRRRAVHRVSRGSGLRSLTGRPLLRPDLVADQRGRAVVCFHIAEFYYQANVATDWGWKVGPPFQFSAWQWQNTYGERPITDTLSALIFDNVFGRFPNIKVLVSEFGAEWVPHFIRHMDKSRGMARGGPWLGGQLKERPSTIFKKHVRVVPYPEDDTIGLIERLDSTETLLMGSDWPHAEGLREPADFYNKVDGLDETVKRAFLRENGMKLSSGIT